MGFRAVKDRPTLKEVYNWRLYFRGHCDCHWIVGIGICKLFLWLFFLFLTVQARL